MQIEIIKQRIFEVRSMKIMLDFDLSELYQVPTKSLNLSVKRNINRFPADFMFQLTPLEWGRIKQLKTTDYEEDNAQRFQFETFERNSTKYTKYLPYAFTEQGLAMLSGVLNSERAIEVNISIMRTFVYLRQFAISHKDLSEKIQALETQFNRQFKDIYDALNFLANKDQQIVKGRKRIGFKPENKLEG